MGTNFGTGTLSLHLPDGRDLHAMIENGKSTSNGTLYGPSDRGTFTITR